MIKNPSYRSNVRLDEEKSPGAKTTRNPNAVDNVNQAMGPRSGNRGTPVKRSEFIDGKDQRTALADTINRAYERRSPTTYSKTKTTIDPTLEGVEENVKPRRFKR